MRMITLCLPDSCSITPLTTILSLATQMFLRRTFGLAKEEAQAVPALAMENLSAHFTVMPRRSSASGLPRQTPVESMIDMYRKKYNSIPWPRFSSPEDPRLSCGVHNRIVRPSSDNLNLCKETAAAPLEAHRVFADMSQHAVNAIQQGNDEERGLDLYIGIFSAPQEVSRRQAARTGWLPPAPGRAGDPGRAGPLGNFVWRHSFIIGVSGLAEAVRARLAAEQEEHGDLLLLDMADSYDNLTLKFVLTLAYVTSRLRPRFFLRMNSNNRLQFGRLVRFLVSLTPEVIEARHPEGFVWGTRNCCSPHLLDDLSCGAIDGGKVRADLLALGGNMVYPSGAGFLMSRRASERVMATYRDHIADSGQLPRGAYEDMFVGYLALLSEVPIRDFTSDGKHFFYAGNCSVGLISLDEAEVSLASRRPGCW
eukprot:TRINITY_DN5720_c0_g2_i1.p1 TRINITY_DN5720_c0_g2~~TRINITY_DN5720_c0_g2_i1.p1  ORF type:complete len:423 (+),score=38.61 TRINITY_DN5720_c0_g2_i1:745-2013(+)